MACDFCDELNGGKNNTFARVYEGRLQSRIVVRTESFAVVPSMGQLSEGHLLILPKVHRLSLGHLTENERRELATVRERVYTALTMLSGTPVWFEHGCVGESTGGCGIYHAHLHAVPVRRDLPIPARLRREFVEHRGVNFDALRRRIETGKPYLFL